MSFERNAEGVTFGWGVVFSDQTVDNLIANDPVSGAIIADEFAHWDDIDVHIHGQSRRLVGPRLHRHRPQAPARNPGRARARARRRASTFECEDDADRRMAEWDLVIAADGINSRVRDAHADAFGVDVEERANRFIWLGTRKTVRRLHLRLRTDRGGLDLGPRLSLRRRLLDLHRRMLARRPGPALGFDAMSQDETIAACEQIFARHLDGAAAAQQRRPSARLGGLAAVPPDHLRALARRQDHPARRRRAHRAFLDRVGDQAGARGCDQAGRGAQPPGLAAGRGAGRISGRALDRSAQAAEQRAQLDRMVRNGRALSRLRAVAIRLFAADPVAAHQP